MESPAYQSNDARRHWGVVGGGMLGMTLALQLRQQGHRVTLLEASAHLGGLADAWQIGDVVWDRHYHVICLSDTVLVRLLGELGLDDQLQWTDVRTGFYGDDGRLVSISSNRDILRNLPLGLLSKIRLGLSILYAARVKDRKALEAISAETWLRRISGDKVFEQLWRPLLRAKLSDNYTLASAAFIWAVIVRLSKARELGFDRERFGYVPGGYSRIIKRFGEHLEAAGVEVHTAASVKSVARGNGELLIETEESVLACDEVAVTLPAPLSARVCKGVSADEVARLEAVQYQGLVCASLLLRRPLADYYLTYITDSGMPFTAVVEMSNLVNKSSELRGHSLVYLPKYVATDDPFLRASDAEVWQAFLPALKRMFPFLNDGDIVHRAVSRVPRVLAIPTLDYSERLPPISTSIPGLHIVNSAHIVDGTLNVNDTMLLAEREAARLGGVRGPVRQRVAV